MYEINEVTITSSYVPFKEKSPRVDNDTHQHTLLSMFLQIYI